MITFQCPTCFHEMRAKEALLGKTVRCKECDESVTVEVYERPNQIDEEPVFETPASAPSVRKKKGRRAGPGHTAARLLVRYSGYVGGAAVLTAVFVTICLNRQFARGAMVLFGGGGLVTCAAAYAWALGQAAGEEPLALLGFVLPRYGLRMILRHRERVRGPLPLFCLGVVAMAMGILSLRMTLPPEGASQSTTSPRQSVATADVGSTPARRAAPRSPATLPLIGGPTPVPTEAIESLSVLKRGMKVWAFDGRWEQGTVVGRSSAEWLVVLMSEGFHQGRELGLPLIHFRIEASELNRDDLKTVTPISQEPAVVPADVREFHEEFERARQKAMKGNRLSFSWSARLSAK